MKKSMQKDKNIIKNSINPIPKNIRTGYPVSSVNLNSNNHTSIFFTVDLYKII